MYELESYFQNYWQRETGKKGKFRINVEFYKYTSTTVKILRKKNDITIRFSSRLKKNDVEALKAGGRIMLHRLLKWRPLPVDKVVFNQFSSELAPLENPDVIINRLINPPIGNFVNLTDHFKVIVDEYFSSNSLPKLHIGWSRNKVRSYYAHFRKDLDLITFNSALDSVIVPAYVIGYLMYHEILHTIYPARLIGGRLSKHTKEFKQQEKIYPDYANARKWLKDNSRKLVR